MGFSPTTIVGPQYVSYSRRAMIHTANTVLRRSYGYLKYHATACEYLLIRLKATKSMSIWKSKASSGGTDSLLE
jgi:hypothetical protein